MTWQGNLKDGNGDAVSNSYGIVGDIGALSEWDIVWFDDVRVPGICSVSVRLDNNLDIQKSNGKKRAYVLDKGQNPRRIQVKVQLLPEQWDAFHENVGVFLQPVNEVEGQPAFFIAHPETEAWGISLVKARSVNSPAPGKDGIKVITIDFIEQVYKPKDVKQGKGPGGGLKVPPSKMAQDFTEAKNTTVSIEFGDLEIEG